MKKTTLRKDKPLYPTAKRVGRPKLNWAKQTYKGAWETTKNNTAIHGTEFTASQEQYDQLIQLAQMRQHPFDTKRSKKPSHDDDFSTATTLHNARVNPPQGGSPTTQTGEPPTGGSPTTQQKGGLPTGGTPAQRHWETKASPRPYGHRNGNGLTNFKAGAPLQVRWHAHPSSSTDAMLPPLPLPARTGGAPTTL